MFLLLMRIRDSRACPRMGVPLRVAKGARSASEDSAGGEGGFY